MLEGNNITLILAIMGIISIYIVVGRRVGLSIYKSMKSDDEDGRIAAAIIGGIFWPIAVPIGIAVDWIVQIVSIPTRVEGNNQESDANNGNQELRDMTERVRTLESSREDSSSESEPETEPRAKFKVGDLITGVSGNPGNYNHLHEGCVCRVIGVESGKAMNVVLVDHMDFNAHREQIGKRFKAPQRYFTLIKAPAKKKVAKTKRKSTKKVAKKKK